MHRSTPILLAALPLLSVACGGGEPALPCGPDASSCAAVAEPAPTASDAAADGGEAAPFRGDGSAMPSFGGWGDAPLPAEAVAAAGFDWFEVGYPGNARGNEILASAGVRPFAYVNLSELAGSLREQSGYTGPSLGWNERWGLDQVDVTDPSWQDWLVRRADEAHRTGSRGIKWDAAVPAVPPGMTRDDVNAAIAAVMQRVRDAHPDLKLLLNQGFEFALAYPWLVDGIQTEGLFSARSYPDAYLRPWEDPFYWGPQFEQAKAVQALGIPVFVAEYADPFGDEARALHDAIVAQGFVPYVTAESWDLRGRGLGVEPGW